MPLSLSVEMKTQSRFGGWCRLLACLLSRHASRGLFVSRLVPRLASLSARPACLPHMPLVSHRLIRSLRVPLFASSSRLSYRFIGSPLASYRSAPRFIDKRDGEGTRSAAASRHAADGGRMAGRSSLWDRGCLLASCGGWRSSAANGGRWRVLAWTACLPRGDGLCHIKMYNAE